MAAVRFTTIPCETNTAKRHIKSDIFAKFVPVLTTLCMLGLKFFRIFLCVFTNVFRDFVGPEKWLNVSVAIYFRYGGL